MTDASARDQQRHHDLYRRDPTSGFLKQQSSQQHPERRDEEPLKYSLPPIHTPEEPFYRIDLPGRHMRYFSNVTSEDREDRHGYYSSARHVAPSNTSGNFGHGPPLSEALNRLNTPRHQHHHHHQQQQQQQQQSHHQHHQQHHSQHQHQHSSHHHPQHEASQRLPSLYTALPDQRPMSNNSPPTSERSDRSTPPHHPYPRSPESSPSDRSGRYHHYSKVKVVQPRSIAPAPLAVSPVASPEMAQPRASSKRSVDRTFVKIEAKESHVAPQNYSSSPSSGPKRKWNREHSPARNPAHGHALEAPISDEASQELHLLSRRSQVLTPPASAKKSNPKTRMQRYQMTTIRCWHGAIAQKSYGIEKRYLCPPPMVQVSAGVNAKQMRAEQPHVTMSVIHEKANVQQQGEMRQDCSLDDVLRCSFRNLHVTGTGSDSSKRFKLGLQVYLNKASSLPTAIMDSNPIPIISKPSKKTAKAGNASCFILNGMSVSLLNRINAQTVRTKYMAVDNNAVCAKIGSWSSFTIKMVKPPPAPPVKVVPASMGVFRAPNHSTKFVPIRMKGEGVPVHQGSVPMSRSASQSNSAPASSSFQHQSFQYRHPQQLQLEPVYVFSNSEPVLYGSEIVLINDLTGIMTDRLIIRKVENGKVSRSGTGPVSQMQKIVLEHPDRVHPEDGRAYYLSASSIGSPKIEGKIPLQAAMDRSPLLEYRTSSKKASIMDLTDSPEDEDELLEDETDFNGQVNSMPRRVGKSHDSVSVDDFVCWTIAGIGKSRTLGFLLHSFFPFLCSIANITSILFHDVFLAKFDYTYFGPIPSSVDSDVDPTKTPTVLSQPQYSAQSNTMTMKVKNVFEKLSPEEEARLSKHQEDPYERKLTISEYVYKRCEDVRQPMRDEEGPVQLWLAQHGPIRMRRRALEEIMPEGHIEEIEEEENEDEVSDEEDATVIPLEDRLPKIATKTNVNTNTSQSNPANGRHYGGSHLPASMSPGAQKPRPMVRKAMGLEAELPFGCEVRATHDAMGHAKAELDLLMVERASGIAYRTGYKVVYTRERERGEWTVEVVCM